MVNSAFMRTAEERPEILVQGIFVVDQFQKKNLSFDKDIAKWLTLLLHNAKQANSTSWAYIQTSQV